MTFPYSNQKANFCTRLPPEVKRDFLQEQLAEHKMAVKYRMG